MQNRDNETGTIPNQNPVRNILVCDGEKMPDIEEIAEEDPQPEKEDSNSEVINGTFANKNRSSSIFSKSVFNEFNVSKRHI